MWYFCSSVVFVGILLAGSAQTYSVLQLHLYIRIITHEARAHRYRYSYRDNTYRDMHETRWSIQVYASKCHFVLCKNMDDIICVDVLRTFNTECRQSSQEGEKYIL